MASFKNLLSSLMDLSRTSSSCFLSKPRTHVLLTLLILLSLLFISASQTNQSPIILATILTSRLLFAANYYISPFSSVSSSNTCLVMDSERNCTLSLITAIERTSGNSRRDQQRYNIITNLSSCDIFNGKWVLDDSQPLYKPWSCPYIDDAFNCLKNGRPDSDYLRYKWRPHGCQLPRFDGRKMLGMLRGKRLVFVGDSLNRNMWESLVCALRESLEDKSMLYELSGRHQFRTRGIYSFKFKHYKCSIDFIKSPFLVQEWKNSDTRRETLRLEMIQGSSSKYYHADIIIFNTGHWWTHYKTFKGYVYNKLEVKEAYTKALRTWAQWVDANIDSNRTRVFFCGYSASHFRNGQWYTGGSCDGETRPITNETYIAPYPWMMRVLESVISEMKTPVFYLNITKMTDYRQDGHPSIYRQQEIRRGLGMIQDCSHWCLPGDPDSWNELLYATLLISHHDLPSK